MLHLVFQVRRLEDTDETLMAYRRCLLMCQELESLGENRSAVATGQGSFSSDTFTPARGAACVVTVWPKSK